MRIALLLVIGLLTASSTQAQTRQPVPRVVAVQVDLQAILAQVFTYPHLTPFLSPLSPDGELLFRYEELPIANGVPLPKPTFDIHRPHQLPVRHITGMQREYGRKVIIVERVIISHDSARVDLRIPSEGAFGNFRLSKGRAGTWRVVKAFVAET